MITNDLLLNEYVQPALFGFLVIFLLATITFYIWKLINKKLISFHRLTLLDKRMQKTNATHLKDPEDQKTKLEATDPIEEAKIFASYGKFEQAIKILKWQIKAFPKEIIPYNELFIIYIHQEDKQAYYKLLKSLPFDNKSSEYQGFLANATLIFPDQFIEKDNTIQSDKNSLSNGSKSIPTKKTEFKINKKLKPLNKCSKKRLVLFKSKVLLYITKLSPLEESIFLAFKGNNLVDSKLLKKKEVYEKLKNTYKKEQIKNNKQVLIRAKKQLGVVKKYQVKEVQKSIINNFEEFLLSKHELKGIDYLEYKINQNPLQEKLYPVLIQSYIEFKLFERYLSFRKEIFSHTIQPGIDIILFITDAENRFSFNKTKLKQVA